MKLRNQKNENVLKCSLRDNAILEAIDLCKILDTEQITALFFNFKSGKRKCQDRMKSLYDRGLVKKTRLSLNTPTVYFQKKLSGIPQHDLALSWVYVWFMKQSAKVLTWELDQLSEFGLKTDALCSTYIQMTKEVRWHCIELERGASSRNRFIKVMNYDDLYKREGFTGSALMKRLDNVQRFPKVVIVTDKAEHGLRIRKAMGESTSTVRYEVHLLSVLKEGII